MGKESNTMANYFTDRERFADFYNGSCFDGENIVRAECLEEDSENYIEKTKNGTTSRSRDVKKRLLTGQSLKILAIENENQIDYTMPWRTMNYDALEYGEQIRRISKENRRSKKLKTNGEFISGLCKEDRLSPTYTICFYHGVEKWDGPRSLKDMMDFGEETERWKQFFSDYQMKLVCLNEITDFSMYHSPLRELFTVLSCRKDKRQMKKLMETDPIYQEMDSETAEVIGVMTGMEEAVNKNRNEGGTVNMCEALRGIVEDSKAEGKAEGMAESIIILLEFIAPVSDMLRQYILAQTDRSVLQNWLRLAAEAHSVEEFENMFSEL